MPQPVSVIADDVARKARSADGYLQRMERLYATSALNQTDLLRAYSGAFLSFHAFAESALERIFFGVLMGRLSCSDGSVRPLVHINSEVIARKVVFGTRRYIDWVPYNNLTIPRATAFLSRGKPFSDIASTDRNHFDNMAVLRNALAHQSSYADTRFTRVFTAGRPLPPNQLRPDGYLRGHHAAGQTRANYLLAETVRIFRVLCH